MANISERKDKNGNIISYRIRVARGYDTGGKKLKPYELSWKPAPGMTSKQIERELNKQAVQFEEQCKQGLAGDGKQKFEAYADYVIQTKEASGELKHHTLVRYRELLRRINAGIGHIKIADIRAQHLNSLYEQLGQDGLRHNAEKAVIKPDIDIKLMLKSQGFTNKEKFARDRAGISVTTLNCACKGEKISLESAEKISAALNVKTDMLFLVEKDNTPLSAKTVREHHVVIHLVLHQAEREGLIPFNPASRAKPPKTKPPKANYFEVEQVAAIIEAVDSEPLKWKTILHLMLATGGRRGEVVGLRWSEIDWAFQQIHITQCIYYEADRGIYIDTPKSEKSVRWIKLPKQTMDLLAEYKEKYYNSIVEAYGGSWKKTIDIPNGDGKIQTVTNDFLFIQDNSSKTGFPMHPDSVTGWCDTFSERNGLQHINPHAFRHTMASVLYFNGMDSVSIAGHLGHAKPSTTQNMYAHVMAEAESRISDCIGDIIFSQKIPKKNNEVSDEISDTKIKIG
jgi:integrase